MGGSPFYGFFGLLDIYLNKVLGDEIARKCYDTQLSFSECSTMPIYDSLNLDEMEHDQESGSANPSRHRIQNR